MRYSEKDHYDGKQQKLIHGQPARLCATQFIAK
jgi:hypothetical protein